MLRFGGNHTWTSGLQERLDRELEFAAVECAMSADDNPATPRAANDRLFFGNCGTSPVSGLHFENAEDPVVS